MTLWGGGREGGREREEALRDRKLDLKGKTKISTADLVSVVLGRRAACRNYAETVADRRNRRDKMIRDSGRTAGD